jgi:hypothetical protein
MDHRVHNGNIMKGVGEESLREEIHNWSRLAAQRQESLQITLGRLSEKKLAGYSKAAHTIAS